MNSYMNFWDKIFNFFGGIWDSFYQSVIYDNRYEFIFEGLDYLKQYGDVYVSEALKRVGKKISYNLHVGVRIENDLLKFDISSHEIPKKELQE